MGSVIDEGRRHASMRLGAGAAALALAFATPVRGDDAPDREHAQWTGLLRRYVSEGRVDYAALKRNGRPALDAYLRGDVEAAAGTLPAFVARYADEPTGEALRRGGVHVEFLGYDWSLDER